MPRLTKLAHVSFEDGLAALAARRAGQTKSAEGHIVTQTVSGAPTPGTAFAADMLRGVADAWRSNNGRGDVKGRMPDEAGDDAAAEKGAMAKEALSWEEIQQQLGEAGGAVSQFYEDNPEAWLPTAGALGGAGLGYLSSFGQPKRRRTPWARTLNGLALGGLGGLAGYGAMKAWPHAEDPTAGDVGGPGQPAADIDEAAQVANYAKEQGAALADPHSVSKAIDASAHYEGSNDWMWDPVEYGFEEAPAEARNEALGTGGGMLAGAGLGATMGPNRNGGLLPQNTLVRQFQDWRSLRPLHRAATTGPGGLSAPDVMPKSRLAAWAFGDRLPGVHAPTVGEIEMQQLDRAARFNKAPGEPELSPVDGVSDETRKAMHDARRQYSRPGPLQNVFDERVEYLNGDAGKTRVPAPPPKPGEKSLPDQKLNHGPVTAQDAYNQVRSDLKMTNRGYGRKGKTLGAMFGAAVGGLGGNVLGNGANAALGYGYGPDE